ncbi:TonB-dependent receptor [Chryseobacterium sp. A301]
MKPLLKLMAFFFGMLVVSAQTSFVLKGNVEDFHNKTKLENATIQLGDRVATSDSDGRFQFKNLPKGHYHVKVTHPECEPYEMGIDLVSSTRITIRMEHHLHDIEAVVVEGAGVKQKSGHSIQTLSSTDLQRLSSETLGSALSNLSGVGILSTGSRISKPIIHGLYGTRVAILNDGVRLNEQEWGVEHAPSVDPSMFQRVRVVKGAGILKYGGDAAGGLVLLEPKTMPRKDTLMGKITASGISSGRGLKLGTDLGKAWENDWFVTTGGSYQKLGDIQIPHHTLQNTGAEQSSFRFAVGKRSFTNGFEASYSGVNQKFGIYRGSHLGGPEDFYDAIASSRPIYLDDFSYQISNPRQEVAHHVVKLEAYHRFANFGKLSAQYDFQINQRKEFDLRRGELSTLPSMDLELITHRLQVDHLIERESWDLETGVFGAIEDNYPDPSTKARRLIPDYYRYNLGIYSTLNYRLSPQFHLGAGARYEFNRYDAYKYYDQSDWESRFESKYSEFEVSHEGSRVLTNPILDYHNLSLSAFANYHVGSDFSLDFGYSRSSRTPSAAELFADGLHHSASTIEVGSLAIESEQIDHFSLTAKVKRPWLEGFSLEVSPYFMHSSNYISQIPTGVQNSNRGVFLIWSFQQTKARLYGVDVDLNWNLTKALKWTSQASGLRGQDLSHDEPLILMQPTQFRNGIEFSGFKSKAYYAKLENLLVLKQKRFPLRNVELSLIEDGQIVEKVLDVSSTPKGYDLWSLSLGGPIAKSLNFDLRITNLLNTEYRDSMNRMRYFSPEQGRNFILTLTYSL